MIGHLQLALFCYPLHHCAWCSRCSLPTTPCGSIALFGLPYCEALHDAAFYVRRRAVIAWRSLSGDVLLVSSFALFELLGSATAFSEKSLVDSGIARFCMILGLCVAAYCPTPWAMQGETDDEHYVLSCDVGAPVDFGFWLAKLGCWL